MQQIATFNNTKNAFAVNGHIKVDLPIGYMVYTLLQVAYLFVNVPMFVQVLTNLCIGELIMNIRKYKTKGVLSAHPI